MTDKSAPAFPNPDVYIPHLEQLAHGHSGMTIRQYAAIAAMQGLVAFTGSYGLGNSPEIISTRAVEIADALLAEMDKAGAE